MIFDRSISNEQQSSRESDTAAPQAHFIPALIWLDPAEVVIVEQPRAAARAAETDDLARSVELVGFSLSVITVFRSSEGQWQLISGERRLRHAREVGLPRIPAFDLTPLPEERRHLAQGLENEVRVALTPFERARWVQDRKVVADILALSAALDCPPPPFASTRQGRAGQLAELTAIAEQRGLTLRPPNVAAWAEVEQELDLDERGRKRLMKLAGLAEDIAAVLEPLGLPQDTLLELADWEEDTRLLAAEAVAGLDEPPTKRAVAVASAVAARLRARMEELRRSGKRQRLDILRDRDDCQHLISYAGEIVLSRHTASDAEEETLSTILAYLGGKYKGRHFGDEDWGRVENERDIDIDDADTDEATDLEHSDQSGAGRQSALARDDDEHDAGGDEIVTAAPTHSRKSDVAGSDDDIEAAVGRAYGELAAVTAQLARADEPTRRRVEVKLAELGLLLDKLVQACW